MSLKLTAVMEQQRKVTQADTNPWNQSLRPTRRMQTVTSPQVGVMGMATVRLAGDAGTEVAQDRVFLLLFHLPVFISPR